MADYKLGEKELKLIVLTPSKRLVDSSAEEIYFPSSMGILGILPGHCPLMCQLGTGVLHYDKQGLTTFLMISGGLGEVVGNTVTLLVDVAEEAANIDLARAEKALKRVRDQLSGSMQAEPLGEKQAAAAEARAVARIDAVIRSGLAKQK